MNPLAQGLHLYRAAFTTMQEKEKNTGFEFYSKPMYTSLLLMATLAQLGGPATVL